MQLYFESSFCPQLTAWTSVCLWLCFGFAVKPKLLCPINYCDTCLSTLLRDLLWCTQLVGNTESHLTKRGRLMVWVSFWVVQDSHTTIIPCALWNSWIQPPTFMCTLDLFITTVRAVVSCPPNLAVGSGHLVSSLHSCAKCILYYLEFWATSCDEASLLACLPCYLPFPCCSQVS